MKKTAKRWIAAVLAAVLMIGVLPTASAASFTDVDPDEYFYSPVQWAVNAGVTTGTSGTTFSPYETCTRAQIVTFLWRANGRPVPKKTYCQFIDVEWGEYYYDAVLWAVENGITTGTDSQHFSPEEGCTRGQVVTFMYRANGNYLYDDGDCPFHDVFYGEYYYVPVLWAVEKGITTGTSQTTFSPDETCTRGQIVTFLFRLLGGLDAPPIAYTRILGDWCWYEITGFGSDPTVTACDCSSMLLDEDGYVYLTRGDVMNGDYYQETGSYCLLGASAGTYTLELTLRSYGEEHTCIVDLSMEGNSFCTIEVVSGSLPIAADVLYEKNLSLNSWLDHVNDRWNTTAVNRYDPSLYDAYSAGVYVPFNDRVYAVTDHSIYRMEHDRAIRLFTTAETLNDSTLAVNGSYLLFLTYNGTVMGMNLKTNRLSCLGYSWDFMDVSVDTNELEIFGLDNDGYAYVGSRSDNLMLRPNLFNGDGFCEYDVYAAGAHDGMICLLSEDWNTGLNLAQIRLMNSGKTVQWIERVQSVRWYLSEWYLFTYGDGNPESDSQESRLWYCNEFYASWTCAWPGMYHGTISGSLLIVSDPNDNYRETVHLIDGSIMPYALEVPPEENESGSSTYLYDEKTGRHFVAELFGGRGSIGSVYTYDAWGDTVWCGEAPASFVTLIYDGYLYSYEPGRLLTHDGYDPTPRIIKLYIPE